MDKTSIEGSVYSTATRTLILETLTLMLYAVSIAYSEIIYMMQDVWIIHRRLCGLSVMGAD